MLVAPVSPSGGTDIHVAVVVLLGMVLLLLLRGAKANAYTKKSDTKTDAEQAMRKNGKVHPRVLLSPICGACKGTKIQI